MDLLWQDQRNPKLQMWCYSYKVAWLPGCLLLSNHKQPRAVVNTTLEKYNFAKMIAVVRKTYKGFKVTNHKTGTTGQAKVTVSIAIQASHGAATAVLRCCCQSMSGGSGIHTLSTNTTPASKLKTSLCFQTTSQVPPSLHQRFHKYCLCTCTCTRHGHLSLGHGHTSLGHSHLSLTLKTQPSLTPVSIHIAQCFGNMSISQSSVPHVAARKGRAQPRLYGEALAENEVLE